MGVHQEESVVIYHYRRRTVNKVEGNYHKNLEFPKRYLFDQVIYFDLVSAKTSVE